MPDSTSVRTATLVTPTAAGEYVFGIARFRHMFEAHSVDIAMLDVMRGGGCRRGRVLGLSSTKKFVQNMRPSSPCWRRN